MQGRERVVPQGSQRKPGGERCRGSFSSRSWGSRVSVSGRSGEGLSRLRVFASKSLWSERADYYFGGLRKTFVQGERYNSESNEAAFGVSLWNAVLAISDPPPPTVPELLKCKSQLRVVLFTGLSVITISDFLS